MSTFSIGKQLVCASCQKSLQSFLERFSESFEIFKLKISFGKKMIMHSVFVTSNSEIILDIKSILVVLISSSSFVPQQHIKI